MRLEVSLRTRVLAALFSLVALMMAAFTVSIVVFANVLEQELLARMVNEELREMIGEEALHGRAELDRHTGLRQWSADVGDEASLPAPIRTMQEGAREIVWTDGTDVFAGKRVHDGRTYAVVADISNVEWMERRLLQTSVAVFVAALLLSTMLALWLARAAPGPISTVVERLRGLDPARPSEVLTPDLPTDEARSIASAIDQYQRRITAMLEREQALTADISHELRTPISVIASSTELMLEEPGLSEPLRARATRIARAAARMRSVVDALLYLAREDASGTDAGTRVELGAVARDTLDLYRPVAESKGLELRTDFSGEHWVIAPSGAPAIVLRNLLENAIRHTERGTITIRLAPGRLAIEDTGVGLAGLDRLRIFERGYRGEASKGAGLGLDLIRRICERAGWTVSALDHVGGGAAFVIDFPEHRPAAPALTKT